MQRQRLFDLEGQLERLMERKVVVARHQIEVLAERLDGGSPLKKLGKGYAYVTDKNGQALKKTEQVSKGDAILVQVVDGKFLALVQEVLKEIERK